MRHVTQERLDDIEPLLEQLRLVDGLDEKKRGNFSRRSRACIHFHEHGRETYADVRVRGTEFERFRVTTKTEQRRLVTMVRAAFAELS